ncbi:hypothetical protein [Carnobacterium maltaromaticum]
MWIEELKNDNFKYTERYTDPYTGKIRSSRLLLKTKQDKLKKKL